MLLLKEKALFPHFTEERNAPLPFSISSLQKDRLTGCLGGIPFRRIGGIVLYCPEEVSNFLSAQPVIQPQRHAVLSAAATNRRGKPSKSESVEAARRGLTVPQLRASASKTGKGGVA